MECPYQQICGGCSLRGLPEAGSREQKFSAVRQLLQKINQSEINFAAPVFIGDQTRRRAALTFRKNKDKICLGFNRRKSHEIVDIASCLLLTPGLNAILPALRELLSALCCIPVQNRNKRKKAAPNFISSGDVWLCEADNGIDIVLEFAEELNLQHRCLISDISQKYAAISRISHRTSPHRESEPVVEKIKPAVKIAGYDVYIPAGTFLQPSREGEQVLIKTVQTYLADTAGKIADLFCGVGTFSYPLAADTGNKITAVDSSSRLLSGFRQSVNKNQISNIEICARNLFKDPLNAKELSGFAGLVFDPPRSGAAAQTAVLASSALQKPRKVVAVSCNPQSFLTDADNLIRGGYHLNEITYVDQFAYSDHSELVALFTLKN